MPLKLLGMGQTRAAYLMPSGRYVIKVPLNSYGYADNISESNQSRGDGWLLKAHKAKCKILRSGLLVMEYVEPISGKEQLPKWTHGVDCCQVGYTLDGRLVAYDYA